MITARVLVVLGSICAVIALLAGYLKFQAFDKPTFKSTAQQLIADDQIRNQLALTMVDELYANVDVPTAIREALPPNAQPLAGPIAGGLRELAYRAAVRLLERPRVQAAFVTAASETQHQLVRLLDDRGTVLRTTGGNVTLNLRPLVVQLGDQVAIVKNLEGRLPGNGVSITIIKSDQLDTAQKITKWLKSIGSFAWIVPFILFAIAIWLAEGNRRKMLRNAAIGAIIAGFLVLVIRRVAGAYIVNHLVASDSVKPAVQDAWGITTQLLADGAWTLIVVALVALLGVWVAGETESGTSVRRKIAGPLARPEVAFGGVALVIVLLVWWGPTPQARRWYLVIAATLILAIGVEALRRQTAREIAAEVRQDLPPAAPVPPAEGTS
jgi:hypothetical protein